MQGIYNTNSQIKFKTSILKSSLCNYSDAYILVKGTITVSNKTAADAATNNANKKKKKYLKIVLLLLIA